MLRTQLEHYNIRIITNILIPLYQTFIMCGEVDCEPGSIELSHADSVKECDCPESIDGF